MQIPPTLPCVESPKSQEHLRLGYVWSIALVAALGGLLFGYDWVVIGGAKPFYQVFFKLDTVQSIGWANSCALIGCLLGALSGGVFSERFGRKRVLLASALLFAMSSVLTGWSFQFFSFVFWRIAGGVAIGLASNVSPTYIAEISPSSWRGRLVSLNQMAIVIGILCAQIVNWRIANQITSGAASINPITSWNVQYGWRWMFTAVAIPAVILMIATPFIPESPRWLAARQRGPEAIQVLRRIGGEQYSLEQYQAIESSLENGTKYVRWAEMLRPGTRKLLIVGLLLVLLQQGSGINVLFNYAQEVYRAAGYGVNDILFNIVITGTINLIFTVFAIMLVDRIGRRRLMLIGGVAIGLSHLGVGWAYHAHLRGTLILILTLCAIASYAMTLAPVTWVLITEIFPNRVRASAVSITVAGLWISSFLLTYTFPLINSSAGPAGAFLVYAGICFAGVGFVYLAVPETAGRSLEQLGEMTISELPSVSGSHRPSRR